MYDTLIKKVDEQLWNTVTLTAGNLPLNALGEYCWVSPFNMDVALIHTMRMMTRAKFSQ